jgi:hypothetical protein
MTVNWAMLLEYLKVILAWPLLIAIVLLTFFRMFRDQIGPFIKNISSLKFPGGEIQQQSSVKSEPPAPKEAPAPPSLSAGTVVTPEQVAEIGRVFDAERAAARLWEYHYLNYFLAPITQWTLDWLISLNGPTTDNAFEAFMNPYVADVQQRQLILQVLANHHLIETMGPAIRVTEKGREYPTWPHRQIMMPTRPYTPP